MPKSHRLNYYNIKSIEKFKPYSGMEDGYKTDNDIILKDGDRYSNEYRSTRHPGYHVSYDKILDDTRIKVKPFLLNTPEKGLVFIEENDYIIRFNNTDKVCKIPEKVFNLLFYIEKEK